MIVNVLTIINLGTINPETIKPGISSRHFLIVSFRPCTFVCVFPARLCLIKFAQIILLTPLMLPIVVSLGVDPIVFGIIMIISPHYCHHIAGPGVRVISRLGHISKQTTAVRQAGGTSYNTSKQAGIFTACITIIMISVQIFANLPLRFGSNRNTQCCKSFCHLGI